MYFSPMIATPLATISSAPTTTRMRAHSGSRGGRGAGGWPGGSVLSGAEGRAPRVPAERVPLAVAMHETPRRRPTGPAVTVQTATVDPPAPTAVKCLTADVSTAVSSCGTRRLPVVRRTPAPGQPTVVTAVNSLR